MRDDILEPRIIPEPLYQVDDPVRLKRAKDHEGQVRDIMIDGGAEIQYLVEFPEGTGPESRWYYEGELEIDYLRLSDDRYMERQPTGGVIGILAAALFTILTVATIWYVLKVLLP
jgi:hypothetical protein